MRKSTTKWFGMLLVIVFAGASYASSPLMKLEYFYAKDGTLIGRAINGARQNYEYDRRGQLLAVKDANGKDVGLGGQALALVFLLAKIRDYPNGGIYCNCIVTKKICVILFHKVNI